jgi:hypothetical protein
MTTTSTPFRPDAEVSAGYWIIDPTHSASNSAFGTGL